LLVFFTLLGFSPAKAAHKTMKLTHGVNFAKLCVPSKKLWMHSAQQKYWCSISPTKFIAEICKICAPFAEHHSPKIASNFLSKKFSKIHWQKV